MSNLERKRLAMKALKELKRTNPDQYALTQQQKYETQSTQKRYWVQAKRGEIWTTLDSTDIQGEAIQFVCEQRWSKQYPDVSWKVVDTDWLKSNRGKSVVMMILINGKMPTDYTPIDLPTAPIFPLESFTRE